MEEKKYTLYMLKSPSNKIYIGITSQNPKVRWNNGKGYLKQTRIYKDILKYGWNNFEHNIILENLKMEEAEKKEKEYIKKYKSDKIEYGYNIEKGGFSGEKLDNETKSKIGKANSGKKNGMYGKHSWNYGKKGCFSKETLEKMSRAKKGKKFDKLQRKEISEKAKQTKIKRYGKDFQKKFYEKLPKETKEKMRRIFIENIKNNRYDNRKKVNQYSLDGKFIKTWDSIVIAGKTLFGNPKGDTISNCCRGVSKSGSGFMWRYYNGNIKDIEPYKRKRRKDASNI